MEKKKLNKSNKDHTNSLAAFFCSSCACFCGCWCDLDPNSDQRTVTMYLRDHQPNFLNLEHRPPAAPAF